MQLETAKQYPYLCAVAQDKGVGFVALGKISLLASREQFEPYLKQIFDLVDEEMATRPKKIDKDWYYKPI